MQKLVNVMPSMPAMQHCVPGLGLSLSLIHSWYIIILILQLSVCESGRSREAIRPELKRLLLYIAGFGRYMRQPTDTARNDTIAVN